MAKAQSAQLIPRALTLFEGWYNLMNSVRTDTENPRRDILIGCGWCNSGCSSCGGCGTGGGGCSGCNGCNSCE